MRGLFIIDKLSFSLEYHRANHELIKTSCDFVRPPVGRTRLSLIKMNSLPIEGETFFPIFLKYTMTTTLVFRSHEAERFDFGCQFDREHEKLSLRHSTDHHSGPVLRCFSAQWYQILRCQRSQVIIHRSIDFFSSANSFTKFSIFSKIHVEKF